MTNNSSDWTAGYIADIGYTHGYFAELNPLRMKLALLYSGLEAPQIETACELGFGQGISVAMHAASSETNWSGTDFNPTHSAFARTLTSAAETQADLGDADFSEFCNRKDLPDFDFIGLHGIWTWISDENRTLIVDFVRRKLRPGGVLYVSYNTLPGWAVIAPLRHLFVEHAAKLSGPAIGSIAKVDAALSFIDGIIENNSHYQLANPTVKAAFEAMKNKDRTYLAHEYLGRDWHPMYFSEMARWLSSAKMSFAASANFLEGVPSINLTATQQQQIAKTPDLVLRETIRDFHVNQQFRRDYWIKGARRISQLERTEQLQALRVVLVRPRIAIPLTVTGRLGVAKLTEAIYSPLLDLLADYQPRSIGEIFIELREIGISFEQIAEAILILAGSRSVAPAQEQDVVSRVQNRTATLNSHLVRRSRGSDEIRYLASPVSGGGIGVDRFQQLFILAHENGFKSPHDVANFTYKVLLTENQRIYKEGKILDTEEDQLTELEAQATEFADNFMPMLCALKIV